LQSFVAISQVRVRRKTIGRLDGRLRGVACRPRSVSPLPKGRGEMKEGGRDRREEAG
jgi:hypothetical protein